MSIGIKRLVLDVLKPHNPTLPYLANQIAKIPGISALTGNQPILEAEGQKNMKRFIAICNSMTEEELDNSRIIKGRRVQRIARGSGTSEKEVKELLQQYNMMRRMMKQLRRKKFPFLTGKQLPKGFR